VNLVPENFRFLIDEYGFRIIGGEIAPIFDNRFVDLTNDEVCIRIARERGLFDAEVRPARGPMVWLPIRYLRQAILGRDPAELVTFEQEATFVRSYLPQIAEAVSEKKIYDTQARTGQVSLDRRTKLFPGSIQKE
jgi:hypothetical protein